METCLNRIFAYHVIFGVVSRTNGSNKSKLILFLLIYLYGVSSDIFVAKGSKNETKLEKTIKERLHNGPLRTNEISLFDFVTV